MATRYGYVFAFISLGLIMYFIVVTKVWNIGFGRMHLIITLNTSGVCTSNSNKTSFTHKHAFHNRSLDMLFVNKDVIFSECRNFSQTSRLLGSLVRSSNDGELYFRTVAASLQDVHLIMRYSPRVDAEGGLNLSVATSYLISKNLQRLSLAQRNRTRMTVFLSEKFDESTYSRMDAWFRQIYEPYVLSMMIMRAPAGNQKSWEFSINYIKRNSQIGLDTIVFQLENDYVCESDMLKDTIEFFASHNPCFVHPTDYPDRYTMPINNDDQHITVVAGRTRVWRSITSATVTYACRLRTLLAFDHVLFQPNNDWANSQLIRKLGGNAAIFSAIPSHCAHLETALRSHGPLDGIQVAAFYKDWWKMAWQALSDTQAYPCCPIRSA
jgi:hypothetical protein